MFYNDIELNSQGDNSFKYYMLKKYIIYFIKWTDLIKVEIDVPTVNGRLKKKGILEDKFSFLHPTPCVYVVYKNLLEINNVCPKRIYL